MSNNDNKELINFENFNYESKTHRLTSPFSIKACLLKGVKEQDIHHIPLNEYIQTNPDSKNIPKELQQERYDNYEQNRLKLIESLKEVRNKLKVENKEKGKEKNEKEKEKEKEDNDEEEKNTVSINDKKFSTIKNKENMRKYKKLKEDMVASIKVQIDREYDREMIRKKYVDDL